MQQAAKYFGPGNLRALIGIIQSTVISITGIGFIQFAASKDKLKNKY